jgi:hypothetical protein
MSFGSPGRRSLVPPVVPQNRSAMIIGDLPSSIKATATCVRTTDWTRGQGGAARPILSTQLSRRRQTVPDQNASVPSTSVGYGHG